MKTLSKSILCITLAFSSFGFAQDTWRGLQLQEENRCSPYDKKEQYPYPQSVEDEIVASMGGVVYGPYTGRYFPSDTRTDIEHIVAASEGHDSGLCNASDAVRERFATDLLNLTLAAPKINRCGPEGKCGLDAGDWLPPRNQCWFANRVVQIKLKYGLSVDYAEAQSLESVLRNCDSFEMVFYPSEQNVRSVSSSIELSPTSDALALYDDNNNGRITCAEARSHGIAPVDRAHPAYKYMYDRDQDGTVCE